MVFRMPTGKAAAAQGGFVYIAVLIGLVMVGVGLGATSQVWTQTRQREKEQELIFAGNQIRQAITRFYLTSPPAMRRFPMNFDELLTDTRTADAPQHFLRRMYLDPMTNSSDWGEVRLPGGQLVGVYSTSREAPLKVTGFALRDKDLADKTQYTEWVFRSALPAANPVLAAGAGYATSGAPAAPPPQTSPPGGFFKPQPRSR